MKKLAKSLCLGMLLSAPLTRTDSCGGPKTLAGGPKTLARYISQGTNLYTQYHKVFYNEDDCDWSANLDLTYRYMQTRNEHKIANNLLNTDCGTLQFQGNDVARNDGSALVATYFGLSSDADFTINLCPRIQNNVFDLQFAIGGEKIWFQANAPLTWTKWRLNKKCTSDVNGTLGTNPLQNGGTIILTSPSATGVYTSTAATVNTDTALYDYVIANPNGIDATYTASNNAVLVNTQIDINTCSLPTILQKSTPVELKNYYQGALDNVSSTMSISANEIAAASSLQQALSGFTFGDLKERIYNKINFEGCKTQWKFADIHLQLGYDFYKHDDKHFGVYAKAVIPTGTKLDDCWAENTFAPTVGNGRHFELGGGISGHMQLWEGDDSEFTAYVDGYMTHMFKATQRRTFDLPGLPMSRYALVKDLSFDSTISLATPNQPTSYTIADNNNSGDAYKYNGLKALGDVNTASVDISVAVRGEAMLDLIYGYKNWEFGAGYAFSGQSRDKMTCYNENTTDGHTYGFLGDAGTASIIFLGNGGAGTAKAATFLNPTEGAFGGGTQIYAKTSSAVANKDAGAYTYGNNADPLPASDTNTFTLPQCNHSGLMNGQILHRIFGHVDYVWSDCSWMPQLGILGSFGFSQDSYRTAEYWDLGARFGFSF
jgi:hypothetical protein